MIFSPQVAITLNSEESAWLVEILLTAHGCVDEEISLNEKEAAFALRLLDGFGVEHDLESAADQIDSEHKLHKENT